MQQTWVQSLGWEDPLEKEMATHSSTLAWRIPWTEEPGRLSGIAKKKACMMDTLLDLPSYLPNKNIQSKGCLGSRRLPIPDPRVFREFPEMCPTVGIWATAAVWLQLVLQPPVAQLPHLWMGCYVGTSMVKELRQ